MKNNSKASFFKTAALIFVLSFSFQSAFSQDNPDDFEEDVDDEPATFIDGFIAVGVAAGAIYGIKALGKKQ